MNDIVLTYFEPFGDRNTNASKEIVSLFKEQYRIYELPVRWNKVGKVLNNIKKPKYLFLVGEAGSYKNITVELIAHNIANGVDNDKIKLENEKIDLNGDDLLSTNIDFSDLDKSISISQNAGSYLCNYAYYKTLQKVKENVYIAFIHVPYIDENNSKDYLAASLHKIIKYAVNKNVNIKYFDHKVQEGLDIREEVFLKEQKFEKEFDKIDEYATHFVAYIDDYAVGTCRIYLEKDNIYHLGRLAIKKEYRNLGIASKLIKEVENYLLKNGYHSLILGSQIRAKEFYIKCGFIEYGEIYYDEYCSHIMMKKTF